MVTALAVVFGLSGCGGGSEPSAGSGEASGSGASGGGGSGPTAQPAAGSSVAQPVATGAQQVVKTVEVTAAKAQETAARATEKAQELLQQAKSLVEEKKIQQAGGLLDQVTGMALEGEQREMLTGLKEEVQKLYTQVEEGLGELKTLVAEKNYTEAAAYVSQLKDYELSPEQAKLYGDLKAQVQQLMESGAGQEAVEAVGNLLGR